MQDLAFDNITTDRISLALFTQKKIEVSVLRIDRIHPLISGNKWFKLRFYIKDAIEKEKRTIVTFGGAYSNHIIATAAVCGLNSLRCIGIIRGEESATPSPTLQQAKQLGMQLLFISREDYALKKVPRAALSGDHYFINEGGYGEMGVKGAATIADHFKQSDFTHIGCAVGTGTMLAGLINASLSEQHLIGISIMKNNYQLEESVKELLHHKTPFQILHDYHFGGYAKHKPELLAFMNEFYRQTNIPSDFVYTGKLLYAITDLIKKDFFPINSRLLFIHSGGLQGNVSLSKGTLIF